MIQRDFLARLAQPLAPSRPPYYVSAPERPDQLVGWYLELEPGQPIPLGANIFFAQATVQQLLSQRTTAA
jgi:hypothetical protein